MGGATQTAQFSQIDERRTPRAVVPFPGEGGVALAGNIAVGVVVETQILEHGDVVIEGGVADGAVDGVEQVAGRIEGEGLGAGAGGLEDAAGGVVAEGLGVLTQ
ncbi:hypothetical protein J5J83_07700 [Azoarcus sp. L1K30]|uniref:hypothetical protein n=1 Tax=Azoarcus sp. L1K30 TaxID=2820277 RepID=UPI001B843720|nr:hypothetical protein [Azoarcus sp. L1K30]MBR0565995.1 hypothetical protein [Azoarcus sp. L1K30]